MQVFKSYNIIFFSIFLILQSCFTASNLTPVPKNSVYSSSQLKLHPEFKVFHDNSDESTLFYKLYTNEIKFSKANTENVNQAVIKISYTITPSFVDKRILDTATIMLSLKYVPLQTSVVSSIKLKNILYKDYIIYINIFDVYGNRKSSDYIRVIRSKQDNSQNFITFQKDNLKPIFKDYLSKSDTILIRHTNNQIKKLYIKYYNKNFDVPIPPFYAIADEGGNDVFPDSIWTIDFSLQAVFNAQKKGIYRIQADSAENRGMLNVIFDNDFPNLKSSKKLAEALQYIASSEEYTAIIQSDNIKLAVDEFWLKTANDPDKAREIIKVWYNRANYSNYYFTSYKEGWKTDRGMIFMVFGAPHNVKYFDYGEQWVYYDSKGIKPIYFNFVKQFNSISDNDYVLKRNVSYQTFWFRAVDSWRKGNIYIYQN